MRPNIALFGRSWLQIFKINWPHIKLIREVIDSDNAIASLVERYSAVFNNKIGKFKGQPAKLHVQSGAIPVHHKYRSDPFTIRHKVEAELDELEKQDIISPITHSEWTTSVVPVVKKNGSICLCGDFKVTLNPELVVDT